MAEKQLQPIKDNPELIEELEAQIDVILYDILFAPLIKSIKENKRIFFNERDNSAIIKAIKSGKIRYGNNIFTGSFNATTAKEFKKLGIKFNKRIKGYTKEMNNLPISIQVAIAQREDSYKQMARQLVATVDKINLNIDEATKNINFDDTLEKVYSDINKQFKKTVTDKIGLSINFTADQIRILSQEYTNNLKLYITEFTQKETLILRQKAEDIVLSGTRAKDFTKIIEERFAVSTKKAKFLAKQEISLLTSKFKQVKYESVGVSKYKWSISNVRTRPDHKALNGKVFSFDDPPISNTSTGARNNPGEDFGCNCQAIPIIEV
jgi:SPP1 gp7 family putative phage head morphogenesis protein